MSRMPTQPISPVTQGAQQNIQQIGAQNLEQQQINNQAAQARAAQMTARRGQDIAAASAEQNRYASLAQAAMQDQSQRDYRDLLREKADMQARLKREDMSAMQKRHEETINLRRDIFNREQQIHLASIKAKLAGYQAGITAEEDYQAGLASLTSMSQDLARRTSMAEAELRGGSADVVEQQRQASLEMQKVINSLDAIAQNGSLRLQDALSESSYALNPETYGMSATGGQRALNFMEWVGTGIPYWLIGEETDPLQRRMAEMSSAEQRILPTGGASGLGAVAGVAGNLLADQGFNVATSLNSKIASNIAEVISANPNQTGAIQSALMTALASASNIGDPSSEAGISALGGVRKQFGEELAKLGVSPYKADVLLDQAAKLASENRKRYGTGGLPDTWSEVPDATEVVTIMTPEGAREMTMTEAMTLKNMWSPDAIRGITNLAATGTSMEELRGYSTQLSGEFKDRETLEGILEAIQDEDIDFTSPLFQDLFASLGGLEGELSDLEVAEDLLESLAEERTDFVSRKPEKVNELELLRQRALDLSELQRTQEMEQQLKDILQ